MATRGRLVPERPAAGRPGPAGPPPVAGGTVVSRAFVGREQELRKLLEVVSRPPAVAVVQGEAGIGKTRLVTELASRPDVTGRRFAVGRCRAIREPFPLGPVVEAVRDLGHALDASRLSPVTGALRPLLPELSGALPPDPGPLDDRVAERHRMFRALAEVLRAAGTATVILEDLHWADEHTVDFLRYALDDPPPGLSWILTLRGEEDGGSVRAVAARLPPQVGRAHLELSPLDRVRTGQLAAAILGVAEVPADVAAHLRERTGGLPFAIEEVLALLRERGRVPDLLGAAGGRVVSDLGVPAAVRDHVRERVGRLPARLRHLLEVLAVLDHPATEQQVAAVSGVPVPEVAAELSHGIRSGLLAEESGAVGFRHLLAAQAVYDSIPGPGRRELHHRAAQVLRREGDQQLGRVAHHLREAGRLDEWAAAAEQAADQAAALGHDDEVVRLLGDVLRRVRLSPGVAGRLALKLGRSAANTLATVDVTDLLSEVLDRDLPAAVRAELQLLLGALLDRTRSGRSRARRLFQAAADDAGDRADVRSLALLALEMRDEPDVCFPRRRQRLEQVLQALPSVADPDARIDLLGKLGLLCAILGDPRWRDLRARMAEHTGGTPRRRSHARAYLTLGEAVSYVGHHPSAEPLLAAALRWAVDHDDGLMQLYCRTALAELAYFTGRWQGLDRELASLTAQLSDLPRLRFRVDLLVAQLGIAQGDVEEAARRLGTAVDETPSYSGFDVIAVVTGQLARVLATQGEVGAAAEVAQRYVDGTATHLVWPAAYRGLPWLVRALTAAGRPDEAAALVTRTRDGLRGRDAPLGPAALAHARGFLATATGDAAAAARHFRSAADHYASLPAPYEAALASEEAALAGAAGGLDDVASPLRWALSTYDELGATRDRDRAARAARRLGVPVPARHRGGSRGYGNDLSPREQEAARLAAAGLTNKEIAAAMFVSVDTVKKHLMSAMRKLGATSRTALARRLSGSG